MTSQGTFPGRQTVELEADLKRQFYPPLVLLSCLLPAYQYKARRAIERSSSSTDSPEERFLDFVNKLAFLACTDPGGDAVSACAVLQRPDEKIQYVFAFNHRSSSKLLQLKQQMESILGKFRQGDFTDDRKKEILRTVLSYNANRVKCYLRAFRKQLRECIGACVKNRTNKSLAIEPCLSELYEASQKTLTRSEIETETGTRTRNCDDDRSDGDYSNINSSDDGNSEADSKEQVNVPATEQLIWLIYRVYKSTVFKSVHDEVSNEERVQNSNCWTELVHVVGRLMSYKQAIEVSTFVQERWPELFDNFEVIMVPSASCLSKVLNARVLTAEEIIRKTTSDSDMLQELNDQAESLQGFWRLDHRIREKWTEKPRPGVHAEMQVFHWIENTEGGTSMARFFLETKYIGTSKPPCKLCHYFFEKYPTDVQVRPSHGNSYMTWRTPDIYVDQGPRAVKLRKKVIQEIKYCIRNDIAQALKEKQRDGRPHDSSNYASRNGIRALGSVDNMSNRMGSLSIVAEEEENKPVKSLDRQQEPVYRPPSPSGAEAGSESDDYDDGGGALLFHGREKSRVKSR